MEQFFMFMYMKKSTKIILVVIVIALFILFTYKVYENGKEEGYKFAKEEAKTLLVSYERSAIANYLGNLIYHIEEWNLGENKGFEKDILSDLSDIRNLITLTSQYQTHGRYYDDYEWNLFYSYIKPNGYDISLPAAILSLQKFYNNLQCFFSDDEYMETIGFMKKVLERKVPYYMEDGILSDEEKQFINDSLELLKQSYEKMPYNMNGISNINYDNLRAAIWLEYATDKSNKRSKIVDFVYGIEE